MRRFLQIVVQIDNKKLVHGILIILLKHIKEFRKTEKRQKNSCKSLEDSYRLVIRFITSWAFSVVRLTEILCFSGLILYYS